jgi:hypothetical protein
MFSHLSRRDLLKLSVTGMLGASVSGWFDLLAARALEQKSKRKACILLWMDGGPSQAHTFDVKDSLKEGGKSYDARRLPRRCRVCRSPSICPRWRRWPTSSRCCAA